MICWFNINNWTSVLDTSKMIFIFDRFPTLFVNLLLKARFFCMLLWEAFAVQGWDAFHVFHNSLHSLSSPLLSRRERFSLSKCTGYTKVKIWSSKTLCCCISLRVFRWKSLSGLEGRLKLAFTSHSFPERELLTKQIQEIHTNTIDHNIQWWLSIDRS